MLQRDLSQHTRTSTTALHPVMRNLDPKLHPFEAGREYTRALNSAKLARVFAKPFVGALEGHSDGINTMAKHPLHLQYLFSGACDGEVRIWSLPTRKAVYAKVLHHGFVQGICVNPAGSAFVSVGQDKTIKICRMDLESEDVQEAVEPLTIVSKEDTFATSGSVVELWSSTRSEPITSFTWGCDTVNTIKFNPVEQNIMATAGDDRSIVLFDIRSSTPIRKLIMGMRTNALCWNPMEAMNFTTANEDHNCYTFDMRNLERALNVHKDHQSAVMSVDYSPTGMAFVTGSYDRTLRIFDRDRGHSREIYNTRRMQRLFAVLWSQDNKYLFSGSDETNVRIWKADASEQLGTKAPRQRAADKYASALRKRFEHHPEVKRIERQRHVPKAIYTAKHTKAEMETAVKRRATNRRKHSQEGSEPFVPERERQIVAVEK